MTQETLTLRERNVESHLRKAVTDTGGLCRKVQWIGRVGAPDRLCAWPTTKRSGFVELKRPAKGAEAHQAREHARLRACGIRVDVLDTIEKVDVYVKEMSGGQHED
jgi:hypothetical protein